MQNPTNPPLNNMSERTTGIVLHGTFIATTILGVLLVLYDGVARSVWFEGRSWVIVTIFLYLLVGELLFKKHSVQSVNWLLIIFYMFIAFCTLTIWGLNAPVGILTVSFAITLPGILIGPRAILPVIGISIITLILVQAIHQISFVTPNIALLSEPSTFWDVIIYSTILSIFALVSWLAGKQREKNLERALQAEAELRAQKDILKIELEKESAALRLAQLNQIRQFHKFALLGQSTAATLHELSNHLSVLNLDIDDLRQQNSNSKAILNAMDSIDHINVMVRHARKQLSTYDQKQPFNAMPVINRNIKDLKAKFNQNNIKVNKISNRGKSSFTLHGSPLALMQIVTVLLNNAIDACADTDSPQIDISIQNTGSALIISVADNGRGIAPQMQKSLFSPVESTKSSGLGVGLYIARHLARHQFGGEITLLDSSVGARFEVVIPR